MTLTRVNTNGITDGTIVDADVSGSAAIAGTKVSPDFGSQNTTTTGTSTAASFIPTGSSVPANGVYLPGANALGLSTNSTERIRVTSGGLVGLGTSAAFSSLHVQSGGTALTTSGGDAASDITFEGATRSYGNGYVANVAVVSNSTVAADAGGGIVFGGKYTGNAFAYFAGIKTGKDNATSSDYGGYLAFATRAHGNNLLEKMRLDSSGRLGIGTTAPGATLDVSKASNNLGLTEVARFGGTAAASNDGYKISFYQTAVGEHGYVGAYYVGGSTWNGVLNGASNFEFRTGGTERARIDSSGRLLVGTSSSVSTGGLLQVVGGDTARPVIHRNINDQYPPVIYLSKARGTGTQIVSNGDALGTIVFVGADGNQVQAAGFIECQVDGTPGANDMPGRIVLSTTRDGQSSPEEKIRVSNDGFTVFKATTANGSFAFANSDTGFYPDGSFGQGLRFGNTYGGGKGFVNFRYNSSEIGQISATGTSGGTATGVAYITTSDYRLKENVVPLTGAIDRLCQLQAHRFNFIADPDKTVDGFLAHEAQTVVPECATGIKDEVDADGNPKYQGIDQSKLVPLLTAALQEALQKIDAMEARLAALEGA